MVVELAKGIKPRKLKTKTVRRRLQIALNKEAKIVKREYKKTVSSWNDPPKFEAITDISGDDVSILVGPTGTAKQVQKFIWVDEGTKPHVITPKRAKVLVFQSGYSPKTLPGKIASYPSGRFGDTVRAKRVNHPGTKPRNFTIIIAKRRRRPFQEAMIKAARLEYGS